MSKKSRYCCPAGHQARLSQSASAPCFLSIARQPEPAARSNVSHGNAISGFGLARSSTACPRLSSIIQLLLRRAAPAPQQEQYHGCSSFHRCLLYSARKDTREHKVDVVHIPSQARCLGRPLLEVRLRAEVVARGRQMREDGTGGERGGRV